MTIKSLKTAGVLTTAMIETINDLSHRIALSAAQVDSGLFERTHRESSANHIYLRALTGDCPNISGLAYGFSIINNGDGKWVKLTLGYPEKLAEDNVSQRRLNSCKRTFGVTLSDEYESIHWTNFLYRHPDHYEQLLNLLKYAAVTIDALAAEHPQRRKHRI